jgi:hypothetical protein
MPISYTTAPGSRPAPFVITKGVKYIKINRTDEQGHDNTLSLQELTNVRLSLDDLGIVDFPVLTIAEYPDYYLYRVGPVILGDSTDKFKSPTNPSSSTDTYTLAAGDNTSPIFYGYTDTTGSIGGTGLYDFPNGGYTVTTTCYFSASASPGTSKEIFYILFTGSNGITSKQFFNPNIGAGVVTGSYSASISYVPTSGSTLGIAFASGSININFNLPSIDFRITQDVTSSINNNILNHTFSASVYTTSSTTIPASSFRYITGSIFNVNSDILGYFNSSTGYYTFGDTPNIKITYSASAIFYASTTQSIIWGIGVDPLSNPGTVGASITVTSSLGQLSLITGSFVPLENGSYFLGVSNLSQTGTAGMDTVQWSFSQSVEPHSESRLTVLEPYLTTNFFYDDCNVLYGNADGLEYDPYIMLVNYDGNGGTVIPSNQQEILNNTAERAPVKPYNYRLLSQIRPRYLGTKNSTDDFNLRTTTQVAYEENSTNEDLGATTLKQPSVSSLGTYFAYFDSLGGTSYELINKKGAHILYLIDKDGNTLTPNLADPYYANLTQNFSSDQKINIAFATSTGNVTNTQGLRPIIKTGVVPKPVIWSQSGSTANSSSQIKFGDDVTLPDFTTVVSLGTGSITGTYFNMMNTSGSYEITNASNTTTLFNSGSGFTNNNSYISSSADSNRVIIKPRVEVTLQGSGLMSLLFRISSNNGNTIIQDIRTSFTTPTTPTLITWDVNIPPTYANPLSSYRYEFYIEAPSSATVNLKSGGVISLLQDPSITIIGSPYWTTGSSSNILVATSSMFSALTQTQIFPTSSGYYSNLPFTLQKLDELRFEGDENQTYVILDPDYATGTTTRGNLTLLLDRDITPGTDLNSFFLRRYIPDPNFILIDVPGSEASGNGFLFPEYTSLDIQDNFDTIIQNLKAKGIIPST